MAGKAAYRIGAGLVQMAVAAPLQAVLAGQLPEATWVPLPHENGFISGEAAGVLASHLERTSCLLLGPGLAQKETTAQFIKLLLTDSALRVTRDEDGVHLPMVVDADGIRLMSQISQWFKLLPPGSILTPHPGEMAALTGLKTADIQGDRLKLAATFAQRWGHVVVLKGALTVVADPGGDVYVVPVATPALAHAGTGDVLSGMIAGLRAQKMAPFAAAWAGAYLHGRAGLIAAQKIGNTASVMASDVSNVIAEALSSVSL